MRTLGIKGIWLLLKDSAIAWDADNVGTGKCAAGNYDGILSCRNLCNNWKG